MNHKLLRDHSMSFRSFYASNCMALLCCSLLVACKPEETSTELASAPLRPVKVLEVSAGSSAAQRVLAATVISADSQNLSFRIGGAITSVLVDVGNRLSAGALVATLDQQPFELKEKEALASLAQADANYRNAQSQFQRTRDLYATEAASLSDLENAKAGSSAARASRSLAQEGVNAAQLNLQYTQLTSPSDNCQVVSLPLAVNQNVSAGQTVATIDCGDQLRMRTIVPESLINKISQGMSVDASLQSGEAVLSGKVVEIAATNANSSGYAVEIELDSPQAAIKVGMAAQVTFSFAGSGKRMLVPLTAVMSDSDERFVYLATPDNDHYRIERQIVQIGELDNDGIEILKGLDVGQRLVVAGMSRISEGMKVTLYSAGKQ